MNVAGRSPFIAFLDLVCCAFGGAVLLFLLTVVANPSNPEVPTPNLLLVRCMPFELSATSRAEVGIEILEPGGTEWRRGRNAGKQMTFFTVPSGAGRGSEAFLAIVDPRRGTWRFRPYLVDYARGEREVQPGARVSVRLSVFGRYDIVGTGAEQPMRVPGDVGQTYTIRIIGRQTEERPM